MDTEQFLKVDVYTLYYLMMNKQVLLSFVCLWKVWDVYSKEVTTKPHEHFLRTHMVYILARI